jgi:hypothetical protein
LSPATDDAKAAGIAIRLISEADPPARATLEVSAALTPEGVDQLSYSELIQVARQFGVTPLDPSEAPPAGLPQAATPPQE